MTVIAYRDGVMAGDSCWSDGNDEGYSGLIETLQGKLVLLESGGLYGGAGAAEDRQLVKVLQLVRNATQLPTSRDLESMSGGISALVVLPDGTCWQIITGKEEGCAYQRTGPYHAIGSGAPIAVGAMWKDATAIEAVKAACEHNVYCRPPITHLKLKG